jgi:aminopeptidase N
MEHDALATTHPIVQRISSADEISQAFDTITYEKGSAVINMLENYVGADAWRAGVRAYMAKHAYGNTVSKDLWSAVEKAAHKPVVAIAHDFTLQPGVPLVSVSDAVCKNGKTTIQLTQGEFSKDQENKKPLSWRVPVIAQTVGNASARTIISGGKATLTLPGCGAVLVNAGQSGYYRTLYAPKAFAALADNFAKLPAIDQLGLLGDTWALGLAGQMPASSFMELASRAPVDAVPEVWQKIAQVLAGLRDAYDEKPEQRAALDRFTRARLAPVLARVGWSAAKDEAATVANLRETLIGALGKSGDEAVLAEARRLYAASLTDKNALPAALRRPVLGVIAANADEATWNQLHAAAKAESSSTTKDELYGLLGAARDKVLAQRALDLALTSEPEATTGAAIIGSVAVRHPDMAFDFAIANLAQVEQKMEAWSRSRYFPRLGSYSADPAMVGKLQNYAKQHLTADATGDTKTAIASVEYRIKVRSKRLPQIDAWLAQHAG